MSVPADAPILTSAVMREAEAACAVQGTPLSELMERAGAAVADIAWRMAAGAPVLVLCGSGNNGGDGYVAAVMPMWVSPWPHQRPSWIMLSMSLASPIRAPQRAAGRR